jgi:tetratricopeptide (TPR) repeat protein
MSGVDRAKAMGSQGQWRDAARLLRDLSFYDGGRTVSRTYIMSEQGHALHQAALADLKARTDQWRTFMGDAKASPQEEQALKEAERVLKEAVRMDDGGVLILGAAMENLGSLLLDLGRPQEARQHLLKAVLIDPTETDRLTYLGTVGVLLGEWAYAANCFDAVEVLGDDPDNYMPGLKAQVHERATERHRHLNVDVFAIFFQDFNLVLLGLAKDIKRVREHIDALKQGPWDRFRNGAFGIVPLTLAEAQANFPLHAATISDPHITETVPFTPAEARRGEIDPTLGMALYFTGANFGQVDHLMIEPCRWVGRNSDWEILPPEALEALSRISAMDPAGLVMGRFITVPPEETHEELNDQAWNEFRVVRDRLVRLGILNPSKMHVIDCSGLLEAKEQALDVEAVEPEADEHVSFEPLEEGAPPSEPSEEVVETFEIADEEVEEDVMEEVMEEVEEEGAFIYEPVAEVEAWEALPEEPVPEMEAPELEPHLSIVTGPDRGEGTMAPVAPSERRGPTMRHMSPIAVIEEAERAWIMVEEGEHVEAAKIFGQLSVQDDGRTLSKSLLLSEMGRSLFLEASRLMPDLALKDASELAMYRPATEQMRHLEQAARAIESAVTIDDGGQALLGDNLELLGECLLLMGRPKEAMGNLEMAILIDPTDLDRPMLMGVAAAMMGEWHYAHGCFEIAEALGRDSEEEWPKLAATADERGHESPIAWTMNYFALYIRDFDLDLLCLVEDLGRAEDIMEALRESPFERFRRCAFGIVPLTEEVASHEFEAEFKVLEEEDREDCLEFTLEDVREGHADPTLGLGLYFMGAALGDVDTPMVSRVYRAARRINWNLVPGKVMRTIPQLSHLADAGVLVGRFETMAPGQKTANLHEDIWLEFHSMREASRHMGVPNPPRMETYDITSVLRVRTDTPRESETGASLGELAWVDWDTFELPLGPY